MKKVNLLVIAIGLIVFTFCTTNVDSKSSTSTEASSYNGGEKYSKDYDKSEFAASESKSSYNSEELSVQAATQNAISDPIAKPQSIQKLIKTGNISYETKNIKETRAKIGQLIAATASYVSNETEDHYSGKSTINLTVRIPAEKFDSFIDQLSAGVDYFEYKNIYVTDVTEQYTDTESRIATKKVVEQKYIALLDKAKTIAEILEIERQIGMLREEIESTEALLKTMTSQISYATLDISFYEVDTTHPTVHEPSMGSKFSDAIAAGWSNIINFFIHLTKNWPALIIWATVLIIVKKKWRIWVNKIKSKLKSTNS